MSNNGINSIAQIFQQIKLEPPMHQPNQPLPDDFSLDFSNDAPSCETPSLDELSDNAELFAEIKSKFNDSNNEKGIANFSAKSSGPKQSDETRDFARKSLYMLRNLSGESEAIVLSSILDNTKHASTIENAPDIELGADAADKLADIILKADSGELQSTPASSELALQFGSIENIVSTFQKMGEDPKYAGQIDGMLNTLVAIMNDDRAAGTIAAAPENIILEDNEVADIYRDMKGNNLDDHGEAQAMLELIQNHPNPSWDTSEYKTPDTPSLTPETFEENLVKMQNNLVSSTPDYDAVQESIDFLKSYEISELVEMYSTLSPVHYSAMMPAFIQLVWDGKIDLGDNYSI